LRAVFSGGVVGKEVNVTCGTFPVKTGSSISIYFQNVNRLRSKTSDVFRAVILNDFDIIVLLEISLVSSFHDQELFDDRYFVFRCDRSAASSSKKSGGGVLIAVRDFYVDVISTRHGLRIEHEVMRVRCSEYSYYKSAVYLVSDVGKPAYECL
jgi:hypothetical protein